MKNYAKLEKLLIKEAQDKLQDKNRNISADYRKALQRQATGKCVTCGEDVHLTEATIENNRSYYKFSCGHGMHFIQIKERIHIREMNTMRLKENGQRKWHLKIKDGSEKSGDKKYPKGVHKYMKVDRKNNLYEQTVIDIATNTVIHAEHMPLSEHKKAR